MLWQRHRIGGRINAVSPRMSDEKTLIPSTAGRNESEHDTRKGKLGGGETGIQGGRQSSLHKGAVRYPLCHWRELEGLLYMI